MMLSGELLNDMAEHRMQIGDSLSLSVGASPAAQKEEEESSSRVPKVLTGIPKPHISFSPAPF